MDYVVCKECKKKLYAYQYNLEDYIYKKGDKYFCSWKCMRDFERETFKPQKNTMEWKQETDNIISAKGEYGVFKILKKDDMYWGLYHGKDNSHLKLPCKRTLEEAKDLCQKNYYWEELGC